MGVVLRVTLVDSVVGALAGDEEGNLLLKQPPESKDLNLLVERGLRIEEGQPSEEFKEIVNKIVDSYGNDVVFIVEDESHAKYLSSQGMQLELSPGHSGLLKLRTVIADVATEEGFISSPKEWGVFLNNVSLQVTRLKLRKVAQKRDLLVIQAIRAIDDIDKTINLFAARLREWYSIHFPELDDLVADHLNYAKIVLAVGDKSELSVSKLREVGLGSGKSERIAEVAKKSIGAELSDFDIKQIQSLAQTMINLNELRSRLTEYIGKVMVEVAPNITELVGPLLGARLLSLAGSLENLAKMPASTIQVLGAEKALFRALRTGGRPPKHGIIFQYPEIHSAPRWQRGKIARALATKLAIAAKADYFTGRYIADRLKKELIERIEEIKKLYPKPPKRAEAPKEERRRSKRRVSKKKFRRGGRRR